jgi:hypothetical protein
MPKWTYLLDLEKLEKGLGGNVDDLRGLLAERGEQGWELASTIFLPARPAASPTPAPILKGMAILIFKSPVED